MHAEGDGNITAGRRGFLRRLAGAGWTIGACLSAASCGLWTLALARFFRPGDTASTARTVVIGRPSDYAQGTVDARYRDSHAFWVVRQAHAGVDQLVVLSAVCTHLGCLTTWQPGQPRFRCPCHGSVFSLTGIPIAGPAPRPLDRLAVRRRDDGRIEVDTSRVFRQDLGQWSDPRSFIALPTEGEA